jgi:hypothetical protein
LCAARVQYRIRTNNKKEEAAMPVSATDPLDPTEMQRAFAREYVTNGADEKKAALSAGYSSKTARTIGYNLLRLPHVVAAVRLEQARQLGGRLSVVALDTLEALMLDKKVSGAVRCDAAKTVLDRSGFVARAPEPAEGSAPKALQDMTVDELDLFIQQGSAAVSKIRDARALPGEASRVDVNDMSMSGLPGGGAASSGASSPKIIN